MRGRSESTSERDDGFTIIELLVSIILFSVVISVFLGATNAMVKDLRKQQGIADAADGNRKAFNLLDKQVRYASGIYTPTTNADGNFYVEWEALDTSGSESCVQWRLVTATDLLQYRTWTATTPVTGQTVPSWTTVTTGVTNTSNPFRLGSNIAGDVTGVATATPSPTGVTLANQRLNVHLTTSRNRPAGNAVTDTTFTALNTTTNAVPTTPDCKVPTS